MSAQFFHSLLLVAMPIVVGSAGPAEPVRLVQPFPDQYLKVVVPPGDKRKELPVNGIGN